MKKALRLSSSLLFTIFMKLNLVIVVRVVEEVLLFDELNP